MKSTDGCQKDLGERGREGGSKARGRGHLTLKVESLLVHSDGECAVVLVIYADHSSLGT